MANFRFLLPDFYLRGKNSVLQGDSGSRNRRKKLSFQLNT
jgi:hypothetical protein